jgi:hypothetical protein
MEEREIQDILVEILHYTINKTSGDTSFHERLTTNVVMAVYKLAAKHSLAHLVARYMFENKIPLEASLKEALKSASIKTAYKHERMKYAYDEICNSFDEAEIPYIPLKGSVLRAYYPEENMRTSCDIDVLVREDNLESAICVLEAIGYRRENRHYHDVSLYAPNGTHLELHFNIQENMDSLDAVLKDAWQYAEPASGSKYDFHNEFFVFHMYAHMAYHFMSGGCGIRSLLDIWVMEHRMGASYSLAAELLQRGGILLFAKEMSRIANLCFTEGETDGEADRILKYIYSGGVYGSMENHIAVYKSEDKGTARYLMRRLFLPYRDMKVSYPILKKLPILLPFCWVARWLRALFGGKTKKLASEMTNAGNVTDGTVSEVKQIRSRLGI